MNNLQSASTPSICHICKENCGILVQNHSHGIRITSIPQHPISRGFLCLRGKNFGEICTSPQSVATTLI